MPTNTQQGLEVRKGRDLDPEWNKTTGTFRKALCLKMAQQHINYEGKGQDCKHGDSN